MDQTFRLMTDTASIALFDPSILREKLGGMNLSDTPFDRIQQVAGRTLALLSLASDGVYVVRVTDGELTDAERAYAGEIIRGLAFVVTSGKVAIGPGESLPQADES